MGGWSTKNIIDNNIEVRTFNSVPISYTTSGNNNFRNTIRCFMIESNGMNKLPYEVIDIILSYFIQPNDFKEKPMITLKDNTEKINKIVQISNDEIAGIVYTDNNFIYEPETFFNIWNIKTGKFVRTVPIQDMKIHDIFSVCHNEVILYGETKSEYIIKVCNLSDDDEMYDLNCNDIYGNVIGYCRGVIKLSNGWIAISFNNKFIQCFEKQYGKWKLVNVIPASIWNFDHKSTICDLGNNMLVNGCGVYYEIWNYVTGNLIKKWENYDLWNYNNTNNTVDSPYLLNCVLSTNIFYCITYHNLMIWKIEEKAVPELVSRARIMEKYSSRFYEVVITNNNHIFIEVTDWKKNYIYIMKNNLPTLTTIEGHIIGKTTDALVCSHNGMIKLIK